MEAHDSDYVHALNIASRPDHIEYWVRRKAENDALFDSFRYVDEFTFRLNEGNVENHTLARLGSFVDATTGKRLTYERLTA